MKNLLIAVIFYNEERNILSTINQIKDLKNDKILINDGSNDKSFSLLTQNYKKKTLNHKKNFGYGRAVKTAANYAKKKRYNYLVIFPGDNQRNSGDIYRMYKYIIKNNLDCVIGSKFHLLKNIPLRRKIGNILFSYFSRLWNNKTKDVLSGFKMYNVQKCIKIINKCPDDYSFDVIFNLISNHKKLKFKEVNVKCNYRNQTSKIQSLFKTFVKLSTRCIYYYIKYNIIK